MYVLTSLLHSMTAVEHIILFQN